ncbi:MAG: hypothetical protein A4E48_00276 [Methanosaeta sp. PtaU1.Bin060]|nr:MAG: hypothetical protein A4E48_00276 [Methanosaeta sp. PtaU1.Bin060]
MPNLKNRLTDTTKRLIRRHLKFEMCLVDEVEWHQEPGDKRFNTVTVLKRDRRAFTDDGKHYYRPKCLVPLPGIGNHLGWLFSPREGDMVMVYFYQERKGIVLFTIPNWAQLPICRPTPCDIALKGGQFRRPKRYQPTGDFLYYPYPEAKKPYCFRWFHGQDAYKAGEIGEGRDWCLIFDYCQLGHSNPECELCKTIDSIERLKNQYFKFYSEQTESRKAYPWRAEFKARCGSFWIFESTDSPGEEYTSEVYTEGEGYWAVQGAKTEDDQEVLKGHIRHHPGGDIEIHSATNDPDDDTGVRCSLAAPESSLWEFAAEIRDFTTGAYVRIEKDGKVMAYSPVEIRLTAPKIVLEGEDEIDLDAPVINQNGVQIHP